MNIQIEPVSVGFNETADSVRLIQGGYVLGSNSTPCRVKVEFFSGNDIKFEKRIEIPSDLIENWTDDEPMIDYVLNELSLVKIEINNMI